MKRSTKTLAVLMVIALLFGVGFLIANSVFRSYLISEVEQQAEAQAEIDSASFEPGRWPLWDLGVKGNLSGASIDLVGERSGLEIGVEPNQINIDRSAAVDAWLGGQQIGPEIVVLEAPINLSGTIDQAFLDSAWPGVSVKIGAEELAATIEVREASEGLVGALSELIPSSLEVEVEATPIVQGDQLVLANSFGVDLAISLGELLGQYCQTDYRIELVPDDSLEVGCVATQDRSLSDL